MQSDSMYNRAEWIMRFLENCLTEYSKSIWIHLSPLDLHFIALVAWNTSKQIATKITREQNQVKVMCHNFGHLLTRVPLWTICDSDVRENEKSFGQFGNRPKTFAAVSRQICQNDIFQFQIIFYLIFQVCDRCREIYWMKRSLLDI